MSKFTPERRAELIASAKAKQAAAIVSDPETVARMMADGIVITYTLTHDEYRALFDDEDRFVFTPSQSAMTELWWKP